MGLAAQIAAQAGGADFDRGPEAAQLERMERDATRITGAQMVLHILAALALGVGAGVGLSGRPIGRPLALGAYTITALGVLADAGAAVWAWVLVRELMPTDGSPDEMRIMGLAYAAAFIPKAIWMLLRLAVAAIGAASLFSAGARTFYANIGPGGVRGVRE